jgi:hypothetical protein
MSASPALLAQGAPPPTGELPPLEPAPAPAPSPATAAPTAPPAAPAATPAPAPAPPPAAYEAPPPAPAYEPPPPPPERPPSEGFEMPHFSVRVDPFNWLLRGLLGFELEVQTPIKFMTVELVPVFVVNEQPPVLSLSGRDDVLSRQSDGIGALAGTSIGLGFWLKGDPFEDYVLRAVFTNYAYGYQATDGSGAVFDQVTHVERHFYGMFGSFSRFGAFTIAGGIGLGVELNKEKRCFVIENNRPVPTRDCRDQELLIKLDPDANTVADLSGGLGGVQIVGRISLGASF